MNAFKTQLYRVSFETANAIGQTSQGNQIAVIPERVVTLTKLSDERYVDFARLSSLAEFIEDNSPQFEKKEAAKIMAKATEYLFS